MGGGAAEETPPPSLRSTLRIQHRGETGPQPVKWTGGRSLPVSVRSKLTDRITTCWLPVHVSVDSGETVNEPVVCPLRTGNVPWTLTLTCSLFGTPLSGFPLLVKRGDVTFAVPVRAILADVTMFSRPPAFQETVRLFPFTVAVGPWL